MTISIDAIIRKAIGWVQVVAEQGGSEREAVEVAQVFVARGRSWPARRIGRHFGASLHAGVSVYHALCHRVVYRGAVVAARS